MPARRILHLHSTFDLGGKEARAVRLMNAFGSDFAHDIVTAVPGAAAAMDAVEPGIDARLLTDFPALAGKPAPARLKRLARAIDGGGYDLALSYNFGAMDAVLARRLFGRTPLIHHEDGFNEDERDRQKPARVLYRRLALPAVEKLVVPSQVLEGLALGQWRQPRARVQRISNGIDTSRFAAPPAASAIPGHTPRAGEVVVGTLAGLRKIKNLPRLVDAFAVAARLVDVPARLIIVGEGPEKAAIMTRAETAGVADRLIMPGFLADPSRYVGLFDIFALSSDSEQFPISLVEAMAAGLPAASTRVGDIEAIVAKENRPLLARTADAEALGRNLARLIGDAALRRAVGAANLAKVKAEYDEGVMISAYRQLYEAAMARQ
ncbi:glycosyltransferase family 4 protein [Pacificimonas sp. WHA3]|uniref:Glycosyltransferase family 4 protein n=1 Tax=Pacificimonas pallii TaxID=2827236 RepID=A0ABS6SBF3_9SPHN|nr:glycosyltransferase family 4 protein [Pacificimonas pallii]MBV7255555.1 glycosyltransferase family 4 protein [Pacificimonas pallii]